MREKLMPRGFDHPSADWWRHSATGLFYNFITFDIVKAGEKISEFLLLPPYSTMLFFSTSNLFPNLWRLSITVSPVSL